MEKSNLDYNKSYHTFHTRDYFRGRSFRYASVWTMGAHYDSDDYNVDFVVHGPVLLACKQSHKASIDNEPTEYTYDTYGNPTDVISSYWDFVLCGIRGKDPGIRINPDTLHWEVSDDRLDPNAEWRDTGVKARFEYEDLTDDDKRDLISNFITQELGQNTDLVISQKTVTDNLNRIDSAIETEIANRAAGDTLITNNLNDEIERAQAAEQSLTSSSSDKTIVVNKTNSGTDLKVNIDGTTITKNSNGVLGTNLVIQKLTNVTDNTVRDEYALIDGAGNYKGVTIKVYKDSTLKSASLVTINNKEYLRLIYIMEDGTERTVDTDFSNFLSKTEFKDGLTVNGENVSVLRDPTSESYLSISSAGIKISGVQNAINASVNIETARATGAESGLNTKIENEITRATGIENGLRSDITTINNTLPLKADLVNGLVPANELPSYVDDVLEFTSSSEFPQTGEKGKIYVATSTNQTYRWSGSVYVPLSSPVDDALSSTSSNPVENRVIKAKFDALDIAIAEAGYKPDEDDITADANKKLMFKDKVYNTSSPNGLGFKYLRSNIVSGKNVLTQSMINLTNTIYHLDEDYDLNNGSITFASGTVLDVHGGSIKNGTVNLNGVKFLHPVNWDTFFVNCTITGVPSPDTLIYENGRWKFYDTTGVKRRFMTEPDSWPELETLSVDPMSVIFDADGGTDSVAVTTNGSDWSIV